MDMNDFRMIMLNRITRCVCVIADEICDDKCNNLLKKSIAIRILSRACKIIEK